MKFLLISENSIDTEQYLKMYKGDYIEHETDVIIRYSIIEAKQIIEKLLIEEQKHFDFIIADFKSDNYYREILTLIQWLKTTNYSYSDKNFKLSSLPIFLMNNEMGLERLFYETLDSEIDLHFDGLVYKPADYQRIGLSNNPLAKGMDRWLDKLKSDIDDLDLDLRSDFSKVDIRIFNARSYKLKVLSHFFISNKKPLDYLWIGNGLQIVESTGTKLEKLLKTYDQNPSLRNEKQIHEFLKTYNHLLKSENFNKSIYEQHYYHQSSLKYGEVDFINIVRNYSINYNEIFEVKLPNQRFFSKTNFEVLKLAQRYFNQISNKYHSYFSNYQNIVEIQKRSEKHNVMINTLDFQYTLLMGRDKDKLQNLFGLNNYMDGLKSKIRLLTYDDLIERHHYLHKRVSRFGI